ncbi:protein HHL1, chloroplastic-like isoform X2 [Phragmites australis]|uniref:protein HHL1, chloroplastic-like isoform X2 n=1 Tax=Phragmites australis TaxID=29695 RepID=UPI002D78C75C|nr:protein HHL1, chloroplastic-like isoform X2 [Phragmites australis]
MTAKIMLASKDNFLGKYIYKDTLARNLAAVIYKLSKKDELKTVVDKVKDFFGEVTTGAKESLAQITGSALSKDAEQAEGEEEKFRSKRRKKRKSKDGGMILSLSTSGAVRQAKQHL